jgi:glycerol-1-phosphate dehydrogenase [NAD(P)+]
MAADLQLEQPAAEICRERCMSDWNTLIREVVAGDWKDPETGKAAVVPFEAIRIEESLDGGAADLCAPLRLGKRIAIVSDSNTHEAMGRRVGKEMRGLASVDEVVFPGDTVCDEPTIARMQHETRHADGVVVVGSGSLCDTVKYATFKDGRRYAAFATAASMNGYAAGTASVTLANGYKTSLPAHAPRGVFIDLEVNAAAPTWLAAAGLGDSLCRPTAKVDWLGAHLLLGTPYSETPFELLAEDEKRMMESASGLAKHSIEANGHLYRVLVLTGFGNVITGTSHSGSMGEHQISHWIDMFAGAAHPGTKHGQQVGVASLAMARLQEEILSLDKPPLIAPTRISETDFLKRYGDAIGRMCYGEARKKAFDDAGAARFNARLEEIWPELRVRLKTAMLPPAQMKEVLASAGGPVDATELGLPRNVWRQAMKYARDIRNRWSFLDLADDAGLLDDFLSRDPQ